MKRDCNTCVYKEGSCYPSTMIFDKDKTCKSYVPDYEDYIAELEKENAELKEKLGDVQMQKAGEKSDLVWKLKTANEQKADQLTEAKEIINNCVHELQIILLHKIRNKERIASILDKAEQFLKEVSE